MGKLHIFWPWMANQPPAVLSRAISDHSIQFAYWCTVYCRHTKPIRQYLSRLSFAPFSAANAFGWCSRRSFLVLFLSPSLPLVDRSIFLAVVGCTPCNIHTFLPLTSFLPRFRSEPPDYREAQAKNQGSITTNKQDDLYGIQLGCRPDRNAKGRTPAYLG